MPPEIESKHVWVRYIIMPVNAFADEAGEPHLEYDRAAVIQVINNPDLRVGCLVCNGAMDDVWGIPCAGPLTEQIDLEAWASGLASDFYKQQGETED